jgi:hypothetical protein
MILDESATIIEGKERVMYQIMQDILYDSENYDIAKSRIQNIFKKLKRLS